MHSSVFPFLGPSAFDFPELGSLSRDRRCTKRNAKKSKNRAAAKVAKASRKRNRS